MSKQKIDKADARVLELDPPCAYCKHLLNMGNQRNDLDPPNNLTGWTCPAFPEGIPFPILTRQLPHTEVFSWQEGDATYESKAYDFDDGEQVITFDGEWVPAGE